MQAAAQPKTEPPRPPCASPKTSFLTRLAAEPHRLELFAAALLLGCIGMFHLLTIRDGHKGGDDGALYMHHARNLAAGQPYVDTGLIVNPDHPLYSPRYYPPLYPLLLALAYAFSGGSVPVMQAQQVCFLVAGLVGVAMCFRRDLTSAALLTLLAATGFNPQVWELKDALISDLLFLALLYGLCAAVETLARKPRLSQRQQMLYGFGVGAAMYASTATRSVGIALIPALLLFCIARWRDVPRWAGVAAFVCMAGVAVQKYSLGDDGYAGMMGVDVQTVASNVTEYARAALIPIDNGYSRMGRWLAGCILAGLTAVGAAVRFRRNQPLLIECFAAVYVAVILAWPAVQGFRFLLPLFPLAMFYVVSAVRLTSTPMLARLRHSGPIAAVTLLALVYGAKYTSLDWGSIPGRYDAVQFNGLCAAVARTTIPGEKIVYYHARALTLCTDRPAASYHAARGADPIWTFMRSHKVRYLAVSTAMADEQRGAIQLVHDRSESFELLYGNPEFRLYRRRVSE